MLKSCIGDEKNRHVHKFSHFIRVSKWRGTERMEKIVKCEGKI